MKTGGNKNKTKNNKVLIVTMTNFENKKLL